jgi:hypothetical protein
MRLKKGISSFIIFALAMMMFALQPAHAAGATETVKTHTMGRFTVKVTYRLEAGCTPVLGDDCYRPVEQEIIGGIFTPPDEPPIPLNADGTYILVDVVNKELMLYDVYRGTAAPLFGRAVVTVRPEQLFTDRVFGQLRSIDRNPTWTPTESAFRKYPELRRELRELKRSSFPPGHPSNAMGVAKLLIDWDVPSAMKSSWLTRHLHGSESYAEGAFWDVTLGCVRLLNEDLLDLLTLLGPRPGKVTFVLYRK